MLAPLVLNARSCAALLPRMAAEAGHVWPSGRFRCAIHVVRTHPPLIRFPGRLRHPQKGPRVRQTTDRTYDVARAPDGTVVWTVVGPLNEGEERSGRWRPSDFGETPPDEGELILIATRPSADVFWRTLSLDSDAPSFKARLHRRESVAGLEGKTEGVEGSHRVGRYADTAPVRTAWSARWSWAKGVERVDLHSAISHGSPQAVGGKPRSFAPLYVTGFEARVVVTPGSR